jgi:hypothetical protein
MYKASKVFCLIVFLFSFALLAVAAQGGAPDITCPNDMSVHNGGNVSSNYSVTDPESDFITLTYWVDPAGPWITNVVLHPSSGYASFNGHVHFDSHCPYPGVYKIWLKAFDGTSYDSCYFQVTVVNNPPVITCPANASAHAGEHFSSTNVVLQDPDGDGMSWVYLYTTPTPFYTPYKSVMHMEWDPTCQDFFNGPVFTIFLEVTDDCGKKDTCSFQVTVTDEPPRITCPHDTSVHAGKKFISSNFFAYDPDDPTGVVESLSVLPVPINMPTIVDNHVEWNTTCEDLAIGPTFTFTLVATDPCGLKDTCEFTVNVYNQPPVLTCPPDSSVHAARDFVSGNFSVTDPEGDPVTVTLCGITPAPTNQPTIVQNHVEWQTACADAGKLFTICLEATDSCGAKDTCYFEVTVYNQTPQITCPEDDSAHAGDNFVSTNFSVTDPEADPVTVALCGVTPSPTNMPILAQNHVEWQTACADAGKLFTICLEATDSCGAKDTCYFQVTVYNQPPQITCPNNDSVHAGDKFVSSNFSVTDPDADPVTVALCGVTPTPTNMPTVVQNHVEWQTACADAGKLFTICLEATDSCGAKDTCYFQVRVTNLPPQIVCPPDDSTGVGHFVSGDFLASDPEGLLDTVYVDGVSPTPDSMPYIVGNHVEWGITSADSGDIYTITLRVTDDCGATDSCFFRVNVGKIPPRGGEVVIPNMVFERFGFGHWDYFPWDTTGYDPEFPETWSHHCIVLDDQACPGWYGINPGDFFEIPIVLDKFDAGLKIGGFELEVDFDYIDLTFYGAERGGLLERRITGPNPIAWQDSIFWSWEYFSYRVLPCATCACCKYKILLYGQAEMPDGQFRRGYCLTTEYLTHSTDSTWWYIDQYKNDCMDQGAAGDIGATLAWLKFQVANNELLRDLKLPIVFEWEAKFDPNPPYHMLQDWDCAENTMSNCDGSKLYVSSNDTLQYDPDVCLGDPLYVKNILNFVDGGVHICSPCTAFTCVRGDINYDDVPYSTADAVLFARYFVYGLQVFTIDRDEQVCATDINADGRTLMLADLIYLIRVIQHDAVEFPKLGPSSDVVNLIVSDGGITVECASAIGGILFKFDGTVTPTLLNANMELLSNEGNVLVWSSDGHSINAGASQLLTVSGELVSVIAVDREGRDLATTITTKLAPSTFALHPAYPNPFNPNTNLSFSLPTAVSYSMNIYNVAGQLVRSYQGMGNVGLNVITWDGKDNAGNAVSSGIYFYKLIAGSFTATNKMIMLK